MPSFAHRWIHRFRQAILPVFLFSSAVLALGCQPITTPEEDTTPKEETITEHESVDDQVMQSKAPPVAGNVFYMMRDVAEVQLKVGDNISSLQQQSEAFSDALNSQNLTVAQTQRNELASQLRTLHNNLTQIELRSQEVSQLRDHMLKTTDDLLASKWLNSAITLNEKDLKQLQAELLQIQNNMLNIARLVMQDTSKAQVETEE